MPASDPLSAHPPLPGRSGCGSCSWGGFESLALCPLYAASGEELDFLGLGEEGRSIIRIHCGLEGADVLIEDLEQAFDRI